MGFRKINYGLDEDTLEFGLWNTHPLNEGEFVGTIKLEL